MHVIIPVKISTALPVTLQQQDKRQNTTHHSGKLVQVTHHMQSPRHIYQATHFVHTIYASSEDFLDAAFKKFCLRSGPNPSTNPLKIP
jgi:hypothetical protein